MTLMHYFLTSLINYLMEFFQQQKKLLLIQFNRVNCLVLITPLAFNISVQGLRLFVVFIRADYAF